MKHLKIFGIAVAAAMALIAFVGASTASAGVLCKTDQVHCSEGWDLKSGDKVTTSLTSGTEAVLKAAFSEIKCKKSHFETELTETGGHNKDVVGDITSFSITECKCGERTPHVTFTELGSVRINSAGTVTSSNTRFTIQCTGLASCIYGTVAGGTDIGQFTNATTAGGASELDASATLTWSSGTGDSGQFVCAGFGDTGTWTASYTLTGEADELWLATT